MSTEQYRCQPGVMRRCKIGIASGCDGTYNGDDCECALDNQAYMPPTEREELQAYRAKIPVDRLDEAAALVKAQDEGPKAGDGVYVLERDEYGEAVDISGFMFLAVAGNGAILSPYIDEIEDLENTVDEHIRETAENMSTDLYVYPTDDVYRTRAEAEAALSGGGGDG